MELKAKLGRVGGLLMISLLGLGICSGAGVADEGILLEEAAAIAESGSLLTDLSTDLLENSPEEEVQTEEIPVFAAEIPEEILRTEIITGARSPITGEPLTAAEYAQLQAALDEPAGTPLVRDDIRYLVFLLQVRRAIRPFLPFIR